MLNVGSASGRRVEECAMATGTQECVTGCEREEVDAVVPRNPPAWCSVVMGAAAGVRCFAGLCVGRACLAALHSVGLALGGGPVARGGFRGQDYRGHKTYR